MSKHWTDEDFLNHLYEVGPGDGHLESCLECRARWEQWLKLRRFTLNPPTLDPGLLARQREQILARTQHGESTGRGKRWALAAALAGAVLFALLARAPNLVPSPENDSERMLLSKADAQLADAQLMSDVYHSVYQSEPGAVEAVQGLFEVDP
ncbi:MAG: hypothetical protein NZV14_16800 [Bryobacteraceae bacterium]|nr:hypothetical protein [Bryobacteraceae bacterium]MDW8379821.1 hypothetical protein [Bryobacterales bacterium]